MKLNEDKKKGGLGFVKVHDANTLGVKETEDQPVGSFKTDVDSENLRLGSAKSITTQEPLKKSDTLEID